MTAFSKCIAILADHQCVTFVLATLKAVSCYATPRLPLPITSRRTNLKRPRQLQESDRRPPKLLLSPEPRPWVCCGVAVEGVAQHQAQRPGLETSSTGKLTEAAVDPSASITLDSSLIVTLPLSALCILVFSHGNPR